MRPLAFAVPVLATALAAQGPSDSAEVVPVLEDWCFGCHGGREPEAGMDLEALPMRPSPCAPS